MNNEASIILKVLDKASAPLKAIGRSFQTMSKDSRQALADSAKVAAGLGAGLAGASAGAIAYAGKQTASMETALGQVASLGVKDLSALAQAGQRFANEWAGTTAPEFVAAAYDVKSGMSNLSDEAVAEFTTLAALTAKATKGTVAEMTSLFASGYGIYREQLKDLSDMEFGRVFSAGIAKAVQDFKTTGPKMQEAVQALGANATKALVPMEEQLVVLGMLQQTMGGSEAGTKYKAFLKDVAKAGGELGLPFLDANKKLKSMPEILDLLRKKYGDTLDEIESHEIQQAFGSEEGVALIKLLYSQTGALRENAKIMGQAMKGGMALTEEMARAMNKGLDEETARLGQRFNVLAEIVGETFSPTLKHLIRGLGDGLVAMQGWVRENPELVKGILLTGLVLGGLVAVLGSVAVAMTLVNLAVLANPITWIVAAIVAGIAALVAAGAWLAANWEDVKNWWSAFWESGWADAIIIGLGAAATAFTGPMGIIIGLAAILMRHWDEVGDFFALLWKTIGNLTDEAVAELRSMIGGIADWVSEKARGLVDWLPDWAKKKLGFSVEDRAEAQRADGQPNPSVPPVAAASSDAATAAQAGTPYGITAAQALCQPQKGEFDGTVRVEFANAPPGTRITQMEERGDSGLNLEAGLTLAYAP